MHFFCGVIINQFKLFFICNPTREVYEERIASYRKIFQAHREYYCQSPLAQKLITLQTEKEEIESRIKAWDDQITMKQKELDYLTGNTCFISSQLVLVELKYLQLSTQLM